MSNDSTGRGFLVGVTFLAVVTGAVAVYYLLILGRLVPGAYGHYLETALVAGFGVLVVILIGHLLRRESQLRLGVDRANRVLDIYRLGAYVVVALLVLAMLGVNGTALLAGGTFAGLVIGLAAQTALSNVVAGVMLLVVRPFGEGDRVSVSTWQYPFLGPAYPPKFYSDDLLVLGYTGTVHSIGIAYTTIRLDDNTQVRLPNNILVQAAVLSHEVKARWVRTKYEIPPQVDPSVLLPQARERIAKSSWVARGETVSVRVVAATQSSYVVVVDALCHGAHEEPPRSAILVELMGLVRDLRAEVGRSTA